MLRGSTDNILDEVERCLDDGVNAYRSLCRDSRMLPGGGAPEIEVARQVRTGQGLLAAGYWPSWRFDKGMVLVMMAVTVAMVL